MKRDKWRESMNLVWFIVGIMCANALPTLFQLGYLGMQIFCSISILIAFGFILRNNNIFGEVKKC